MATATVALAFAGSLFAAPGASFGDDETAHQQVYETVRLFDVAPVIEAEAPEATEGQAVEAEPIEAPAVTLMSGRTLAGASDQDDPEADGADAIAAEEGALPPIAVHEAQVTYALVEREGAKSSLPIVSATVPLYATEDPVVPPAVEATEEGEQISQDAAVADATTGANQQAMVAVMASFVIDGCAYAIEPDGETVALVSATPRAQGTLAIPAAVQDVTGAVYEVSRIAPGALSDPALAAIFVAPDNAAFASCNGALYDKDLTTLLKVPAAAASVAVAPTCEAVADDALVGCPELEAVIWPAAEAEVAQGAFGDADAEGAAPVLAQELGATSQAIDVAELVVATDSDQARAAWEEAGIGRFAALAQPGVVIESDGLAFVVSDELALVVAGAAGEVPSELVVPASAKVDGVAYPVVAIADGAFAGEVGLESVELPPTLCAIGERAFEGSGLAKASFDEAVVAVGDRAFADCPGLEERDEDGEVVAASDDAAGDTTAIDPSSAFGTVPVASAINGATSYSIPASGISVVSATGSVYRQFYNSKTGKSTYENFTATASLPYVPAHPWSTLSYSSLGCLSSDAINANNVSVIYYLGTSGYQSGVTRQFVTATRSDGTVWWGNMPRGTMYSATALATTTSVRVYLNGCEPKSITFNLNGGMKGSGTYPTSYVPEATWSLNLTPTRTGYNFTGWTVTGSWGGASGYVNTGVAYSSMTFQGSYHGNLTFTANWSKKANVSVYLSGYNYGSSSNTSYVYYWPDMGYVTTSTGTTTVAKGSNIIPTSKLPTRPGYAFLGYYSASTGGTQYIDASGNLTSNAPALTASTTWYAQWQKKSTYSVTLDGYSYGSYSNTHYVYYWPDMGYVKSSSDTTIVNRGSNIISADKLPTREGYTFEGYYSASSGGTRYIDSGGNLTTSAPTLTASTTWYARFTASSSYRVTLDGQGGAGRVVYYWPGAGYTTTSTSTTAVKVGATLVSSVPTATGYIFKGYSEYSTASSSTKYCIDASGKLTADAPTLTKNTTFFALWDPVSYTIAFNSNYPTSSGTAGTMTSVAAEYDKNVTLPRCAFIAPGYTAVEWNTKADGTGTSYPLSITEDTQAIAPNLTTTQGATVSLYCIWRQTNAYALSGASVQMNPAQSYSYTGTTYAFMYGSITGTVSWSGTRPTSSGAQDPGILVTLDVKSYTPNAAVDTASELSSRASSYWGRSGRTLLGFRSNTGDFISVDDLVTNKRFRVTYRIDYWHTTYNCFSATSVQNRYYYSTSNIYSAFTAVYDSDGTFSLSNAAMKLGVTQLQDGSTESLFLNGTITSGTITSTDGAPTAYGCRSSLVTVTVNSWTDSSGTNTKWDRQAQATTYFHAYGRTLVGYRTNTGSFISVADLTGGDAYKNEGFTFTFRLDYNVATYRTFSSSSLYAYGAYPVFTAVYDYVAVNTADTYEVNRNTLRFGVTNNTAGSTNGNSSSDAYPYAIFATNWRGSVTYDRSWSGTTFTEGTVFTVSVMSYQQQLTQQQMQANAATYLGGGSGAILRGFSTNTGDFISLEDMYSGKPFSFTFQLPANQSYPDFGLTMSTYYGLTLTVQGASSVLTAEYDSTDGTMSSTTMTLAPTQASASTSASYYFAYGTLKGTISWTLNSSLAQASGSVVTVRATSFTPSTSTSYVPYESSLRTRAQSYFGASGRFLLGFRSNTGDFISVSDLYSGKPFEFTYRIPTRNTTYSYASTSYVRSYYLSSYKAFTAEYASGVVAHYFSANGGTSTPNPQVTYSNVNSTLAVPAAPTAPSGFTFAGWYTASTWASSSSAPVSSGTSTSTDGVRLKVNDSTAELSKNFGSTVNQTLYALWYRDIALDANEGTIGATGTTWRVYRNETLRPLTLAGSDWAPTRGAWEFKGFANSKTNGTTYYSTAGTSSYTASTSTPTTLYAIWEWHTYQITYDTDGGTLPEGVANPTTYDGETPTFSLPVPTKQGYVFTGWMETYEDGSSAIVSEIPQGSSGDRAFTATWRPSAYTIRFDLGGGQAAWDGNEPTIEDDLVPGVETSYDGTTTLPAPKRPGHAFGGWAFTQGEGDEQTTAIYEADVVYGPAGNEERPPLNLTDQVGGEVTLVARWTPVLAIDVPVKVELEVFIDWGNDQLVVTGGDDAKLTSRSTADLMVVGVDDEGVYDQETGELAASVALGDKADQSGITIAAAADGSSVHFVPFAGSASDASGLAGLVVPALGSPGGADLPVRYGIRLDGFALEEVAPWVESTEVARLYYTVAFVDPTV